MKTRQKPTKVNNNPYDALEDEKDKIYVDMAVTGYKYSHIAKKAKLQHQTVREWFSKGGRLQEAYKFRLKEHRKEYDKTFKELDKMLKDGAVDAVLKLLEAVKSGGLWPTHIQAAKEILAQAGFVPTQKVVADLNHKTDTAVVDAAKQLLDEK